MARIARPALTASWNSSVLGLKRRWPIGRWTAIAAPPHGRSAMGSQPVARGLYPKLPSLARAASADSLAMACS
eukprot:11481026-Alexandrium_andersonii.AAC.1